MPSAKTSQVVVRMLAAPVHELDAAVVSGRAGRFVGTAGNEGVGVVTSVGAGVNNIAVNDWVVPAAAGLGTFAEYVVADASKLSVVPNDIRVADAALIGGTAATALRLLSDFGATGSVIQNNANGPVGQAIVQIAKARGIMTINIIPDGPDADAAVEHLYSLGADIVVTESFAASAKFGPLVADLPAPSLGINGSGGASATTVARTVAEGSTVVTYGGSAAVQVPTSLLVSRGLSLIGFSLGRWYAKSSPAARASATSTITALVQNGALKATVQETPFSDVLGALQGFGARSRQALATPLVTM